ncbi:LPXTG cell wall anchor domain-containing protein, partial [Enterococcus faecalis]
GDKVSVPKEVPSYADNKNDSIKYSNLLPKTGEDNIVGLSLLGIIGVISSLFGFLVFKNKNN